MKKKESKMLEENLLSAFKKVLQDNKAVLKNKIEKAIKKSIKQIAKKTGKKIKSVSKQKEKRVNPLKSNKF